MNLSELHTCCDNKSRYFTTYDNKEVLLVCNEHWQEDQYQVGKVKAYDLKLRCYV